MRDRVRIKLTAYLDLPPEDLEAVGGDAFQAALLELAHTGLDLTSADVEDFLMYDPEVEREYLDDDISWDALVQEEFDDER